MSAVDGEASQVGATPVAQNDRGDSTEDEHMRWLQTLLAGALTDDGVQSSLLGGLPDLPNLDGTGDAGQRGEASYDALAVEQEIAQLLDLRETVSVLLDTSEAYIAALKSAVQHLREATDEVLQLKEYLIRTEEQFASDQRREIASIYRESVSLPRFPAILRDIPRLAYQAKEIADIRLLSWRHRWTARSSGRLETIVLNQCRKIVTMQYAGDASVDALTVASGMTDQQLASVSLPVDDGNGEDDAGGRDPIDWTFVATTMGTWHTPNECRTYWLMKQRPGLRGNATLDATQLTRLSNGVSFYSQQNGGMVTDWEHIASRLCNGMLAVQCFSTAQRHSMMPAFAATMPSAWANVKFRQGEAQEMEKLCGVWGNRLVIITERLGTGRPKSSVGTHVTRLLSQSSNADSWAPRADEGLIVYLCSTLSVRRPKLFAEPHLAEKANWSGHFVGKRSGITPAQVKARWLHILDEFTRRPGKYLTKGTSGQSGCRGANAGELGVLQTATESPAEVARRKRGRGDDDADQSNPHMSATQVRQRRQL